MFRKSLTSNITALSFSAIPDPVLLIGTESGTSAGSEDECLVYLH